MVTGIAGISGGLVSAFFTGMLDARFCFAYYAMFGVVVVITSACLDPELETENDPDAITLANAR